MISFPLRTWPDDTFEATEQSRCFDAAMHDIACKASELRNPDVMEEEGYLLWVMGRLMMVEAFPAPSKDLYEVHPQGRGVQVFRQRMGRVEFCFLLLEPGGHIPCHEHKNCNGVMRVLKGDVTTHNYDLMERNLGGVLLQPSMQAWITPGRMFSLARNRDNVHQVTAGSKGALLLDVFTLFSSDAGSRYLELDDGRAGVTHACWVNAEYDE